MTRLNQNLGKRPAPERVLSKSVMREWGESDHHGHSKKYPPADLKSVKPTGAHPLPSIFLGQLYQAISALRK